MKTILFIIMLCSISSSFSQNLCCGFRADSTQKTKFLARIKKTIPTFNFAPSQVVEVLVVVHVIFNNAARNIPDDLIKREIEDLSRDFQLLNTADTSKLPEAFKKLVGNAAIRFRLAATDEQGNVTTGIIRKKAGRRVYDFKHHIFFADKIWNPQKFLNIYIGNIRNGKTRGYVNSFPWRHTSTDAVGLYFEDVGKGIRLLTHETGHWLGLWHITESGCSAVNDGIEDTPKQSTFTRGCPALKTECANACMFMNYMDYSGCRIMFTQGQAIRMRQVIEQFRPALIR